MAERSLREQFTDGAFIATLVTGCLYLGTQIFNNFKARLFKYPTDLVEVELGSIIDFATNILLFVLLIATVGGILSALLTKLFRVHITTAIGLVMINMMYIMAILTSILKTESFNILLGAILMLDIFFIAGCIYTRKRLAIQPLYILQDYSLRLLFYVIVSLLIFISSSRYLAVDSVIRSNRYYITGKNVIIAGKYKDFFIGKPYNLKTGIITDTVLFIKQSDTVIIRRVKIPNLELGKNYYTIYKESLL